MNSKKIYESVRNFISNHDHKFENVFVHAWEADVFSVTTTPYCYEIEVKVSRSDYFADFKKPKHELFRSVLPIDGSKVPNKFFYAVPVGLIEIHEAPKYAGLIYVMDSGSFRIIKPAPFIHKELFDIKKMLFNKYYYMSIDQRNEIWDLKREVESLKNQLEEYAQKV